MKYRPLFLATCIASALTFSTRAQTKPDFSGVWKMNLEKSKLSSGEPISYYKEFTQEIDHRDPKLRIVEKITNPDGAARTVEWNVTTDGKEYETKVMDTPAKISAKWEGDRLVARIQWGTGNDVYLVTRKYALSEDGHSVVADWEVTTSEGSESATEIWEKQ